MHKGAILNFPFFVYNGTTVLVDRGCIRSFHTISFQSVCIMFALLSVFILQTRVI